MTILLIATSKIANIKISLIRLLIISVLSSIVSIILLVYLPTLYDNLLIKYLISFFIVKYGMKIKENNTTIQDVLMFWIIAIFMGGTNIFLNENNVLTLLIFIISMTIIYTTKKNNKKLLLLESTMCYVEFEHYHHLYKYKALVDTGHDVKSIFGEDVIFVKDILYDKGGDINKRLVSYKTISGIENNKGIKINNIKIIYGDKTFYSNAVIVSTPNILQKYDAIIGYDFIEGGITDGNLNVNKAESKKIVC